MPGLIGYDCCCEYEASVEVMESVEVYGHERWLARMPNCLSLFSHILTIWCCPSGSGVGLLLPSGWDPSANYPGAEIHTVVAEEGWSLSVCRSYSGIMVGAIHDVPR